MNIEDLRLFRVSGKLEPAVLAALRMLVPDLKDGIISEAEGDCGCHRYIELNTVTGDVVIEEPNMNPNVGTGTIDDRYFAVGENMDVQLDNFGFNFTIDTSEVIPLESGRNVEGLEKLRSFVSKH